MKKLSLFLVLFVILVSCSQDEELSVFSENLFGKWEWKSTNGGEAHHIYKTSEGVDKIVHLNLMSNFKYSIFLNEIETDSGTYSIINKKSNLTDENEQFISITVNSEESKEIVVFEGLIKIYNYSNSLFINQDFEEGIGSIFERVE